MAQRNVPSSMSALGTETSTNKKPKLFIEVQRACDKVITEKATSLTATWLRKYFAHLVVGQRIEDLSACL